MGRKGIVFIFLLCGSILLTGCRKDLCYDHDGHGLKVSAFLIPDWEQEWERDYGMEWQSNWPEKHEIEYDLLRPSIASGIAAFVYHGDGSYSERHLESDGGELPMVTAGEKSILLCNDDTHYIVFGNLDASAEATATTRSRSRSTYNAEHAEERTVNAPDILYGAWIDRFSSVPSSKPIPLPVTMHPLVYTYLIRYEFSEGFEHVSLARGAHSGMARSVYLQTGRTGEEPATILFDCELKDFGAEVRLTSFGVPDFPGDHYLLNQTPHQHGLNLEVMLKNGKMKRFEFDVSDQLVSQPRGGVITVDNLVVTDEEAGGDAGFDVTVEGWGEYEDIELPLD